MAAFPVKAPERAAVRGAWTRSPTVNILGLTIIVSLYSFLICLKCFPGVFFIQRVQSHVSAFRVRIDLHPLSNLSFFCSIPELLGKLSLPCFSCSYGFFRGIRTSITGLKHLYLAHELGEPTNLGIAKPTPDETDSSTSGCSTCWLVT